MRPFVHPRQAQNSFDPNSYYRFYNDVYPKNTISAGIAKSSNGAINMTIEQTFSSSENWQLYYQQGRYFIRNYDYGSGFQLGINKTSTSVPRLLPTSGELGQQWTLAKLDGGLWKMTNGLLGNDSALGLAGANTIPGMQPSDDGTSWTISLNPSAGAPKDKAMLRDVANFEVAPSSSSSLLPSATSSSSPSSVSSTGVSATQTHSSINAPSPSSSSKGASISGGAIAGIVVGAVLLLVVLGLITYHLLSRRKQRQEVTELSGHAVLPPSEKYAHDYRQHGQPGIQNRAELG